MAQIKSPCKGCVDRVIGCHSTCVRYQEFFKLNEKRKEEQDKNREIDSVLRSYNKSKTSASKISTYGKRKVAYK